MSSTIASSSQATITSCGQASSFVEFDVEYVPAIAGGRIGQYASEIYPIRLDVHGTHELSHTENCGDGAKVTQHTILHSGADHTFHVRVDRHSGKSQCRQTPYYDAGAYAQPLSQCKNDSDVAASTVVMLNAFATTYTETGQQCWTHAGSALVPIAMILDHAEYKVSDDRVELVHNRDNDGGAKPVVKGKLKLSNFGVRGITVCNPNSDDIDINASRMSEAATKMTEVINRGMLAFFGPEMRGSEDGLPRDRMVVQGCVGAFLTRVTRPFLRRFHVPVFNTVRNCIPSSAYSMLLPSGPLDPAYFERLIDIALKRSALSRGKAMTLGEAAIDFSGPEHENYAFASFAVRAVSVFALSQCYLDDFLNRNLSARAWKDSLIEGDEDFKIARLCGADDCEGVALEIHMHIRQLAHADPAGLSPLLQLMRRFFRLFVPALTLGCVTNKKLTAAELDQNTVMAHTFSTLLPYWHFYDMSSDHAREWLDKSRFFEERRAELGKHAHTWTPLIGEGTAPIDPAMRPVSAYYSKYPKERAKALASAAKRRAVSMDILKILDDHKQRNLSIEAFGAPDAVGEQRSPFYQYPVSMMTPEFADLRTFDWTFVYNRDDPRGRVVGVSFADLVDGAGSVGVMAHLDLTEQEARLIDIILLDEQPIPVLRLADQVTVSSAARQLAVLTKTSQAGGTVLHPRQTFLTMRARDFTSQTKDALNEIAALPYVRSFEVKFWSLNRAVDGSGVDNVIVDVYVGF